MRLRGITYQLVCACFILSTLWLSSTADFTTSPPKSEPKSLEKKFEQWLGHHGKEYKTKDEWSLRFSIYQANIQLIDFINSQNYSFKLADNKFADMTNDEFRSSYLGRMSMTTKGSRESKRNRDAHVDKKPLPERVDWRKKGAVTSVKDQGECGSCWAFSAVAAIEGLHKIKSGKLLDLSEQVLLDCDTKGKNQGCAGGFMDKAFEFIHKHGGLTTEKDYPYKGKQHTCNQTKLSHHSVSISGYKTVPENDAKSLQAAIARQPVSVAIDAGHFAFQLYGGGVYSIFCGKNLNHGVTAVGYGQEGRDKYWLVKNSWGENWGEGGYIRINRGLSDKSGTCGIAMEASYPMKKSKKYEK